MQLDWSRLLDEARFRPTTKVAGDRRNEFERDYDRLVTSSAFRRMQDKAQVFPLERSDFVRTRLTHSLEVERLGSSLARDVYRQKPNLFGGAPEAAIESLVGTACLVHDIGNPPFGHSGENSIQVWFDEHKDEYLRGLPTDLQQDFLHFEGNAQGFRIATKLQWLNDEYGLNFTFATLGVMMKYLSSSSDTDASRQSRKKPGYFQAERQRAQRVWDAIGTEGKCRHPLTFLMEAADDLAYAAADIEDAVKKRALSMETLRDELIAAESSSDSGLRAITESTLVRKHDDPDSVTNAVQNFRIRVIGAMFRHTASEFLNRYDDIMSGTYDKQLIDTSAAGPIAKALKKTAAKYVYSNPAVLTLESAGDHVIRSLLDKFVPAATDVDVNARAGHRKSKLFQLISPRFRAICDAEITNSRLDPRYHRYLLVTDFICGMTDTYALSLHQKLHGINVD